MMKQISFTLDGAPYQCECSLGQTLGKFLHEMGVRPIPEFVQSRGGRTLSTEYSLVHLLQEFEFRTLESVDETPVSALTREDVLPALSGPRLA